jgi:hypothetical protein
VFAKAINDIQAVFKGVLRPFLRRFVGFAENIAALTEKNQFF